MTTTKIQRFPKLPFACNFFEFVIKVAEVNTSLRIGKISYLGINKVFVVVVLLNLIISYGFFGQQFCNTGSTDVIDARTSQKFSIR